MANLNPKYIANSVESLYQWVRFNRYMGWDPYDGLNTRFITKVENPYIKILAIQFNKYSPFNFRPILKIKEGIDVKGIALFSQAYSILYGLTGQKKFKTELKWTIKFLIRNSLKEVYDHYLWSSHYFPVVGADKHTLAPDIPDIIGTSCAIKALSMASKILKKKSLLNYVQNSVEYIIKNMISEYKGRKYILYTPFDQNRIVPDATALFLDAVSNGYGEEINGDMVYLVEGLVETLIALQKPNGSWPHAIYINSNSEYNQIDYHQGFLIDGLISVIRYIDGKDRNQLVKTINQAIDLYKKTFLPNGQSYYRYPKRYPVDIHNQSQGIITFSKLYLYFNDPEYLQFAKKIALWTIENMQDNTGYYYYQKGRIITNKIPYMRWSQAWMMLALATLLNAYIQGGRP